MNFSKALGDVNLVLGGSYTTNNPLIGQIEMLLISNTYFLDNNNYNNIKNMFFMNKYSEIDDLGRLIKSGVKNKDNNIITNELEYQIINSTPTYNVSKEIIKYGNNTINRSYSYGSNNKKNNITNISDSIFGNKSYGYNYRGYLVDDNGISITYDSNGNILTYGSKSFIYDSIVKDKLIKVGNNSISYGSNTLLPSYYKDKNFIYEGNRLKRIIISGADETTFIDYYYDLNGLRIKKEVITEYNDDRINEFEIIKYYYEGNRLITEYKDENKRLDFLYDNNGILYGFIENKTNIYYYVRDCMQNILGIIDSNKTIVVKYNYNAYGEILSTTGNPYIGSKNPFRYKGYYYDDETNLYYCNSRYYVTEWCRWLTPDSVEYLDSSNINVLNLFSYCGNDPVNMYDPDGNSAVLALILAGTFAVGFGSSLLINAAHNDWQLDWRGFAQAGVDGLFAMGSTLLAMIGIGFWASVGIGAAMGWSQYALGTTIQDDDITWLDSLTAIGFGALGGAISGAGAANTRNIANNMVGLSDDGARALGAITKAANRRFLNQISPKGMQATLNRWGKIAFEAVQSATPGTMKMLFMQSARNIVIYTPLANIVTGGLNHGYKVWRWI